MPKTAPHTHGDPAAPDGARSPANAPQALAKEAFPPLTISLETFVKDGSDRGFRELIFDLIALNNQMQSHVDRFARHIGTTNGQFHVLMALARTSGLTAGELAELMNVMSPLATIEIGGLVRKGLIERRSNENNRRSSLLNLTPKGRELVRQVAPLLRRVNDLHFRSLTAERAALLTETVHAIVADGRRIMDELDAPDASDAMGRPARPET
jgi:MarR family transcriptional regulator, organic hydroperoxide resistance regulator